MHHLLKTPALVNPLIHLSIDVKWEIFMFFKVRKKIVMARITDHKKYFSLIAALLNNIQI